jgi:hypothetical protein
MRERQISRPQSACQRAWEPLQHNRRKTHHAGAEVLHARIQLPLVLCHVTQKAQQWTSRSRSLRLTRGSVGMEVDG